MEISLLPVRNELWMAADEQKVTLIIIDLSAAFDTIQHKIIFYLLLFILL